MSVRKVLIVAAVAALILDAVAPVALPRLGAMDWLGAALFLFFSPALLLGAAMGGSWDSPSASALAVGMFVEMFVVISIVGLAVRSRRARRMRRDLSLPADAR